MDKMNTINVVCDVFNAAMSVQELYLRKSPFKQLSLTEMHVLEAVQQEKQPSMSVVAKHLHITLGTLTTAVKKIIEKGFLEKERSSKDQRMYFLRLTPQGEEALKIHEQFHQKLAGIYVNHIPDDKIEWIFSTLKEIEDDILQFKEEISK